jgi:hypothetical protein
LKYLYLRGTNVDVSTLKNKLPNLDVFQ